MGMGTLGIFLLEISRVIYLEIKETPPCRISEPNEVKNS